MQKKDPEIFYAANAGAWREWLKKNHLVEDAVWLVLHKKSSAKHTINWREAVDVALCFGWIDSKKIKIDEETSHQFFSKRKAKGTWSKINKQIIEQLIENGLMEEAGFKSIELAKQNGSWNILDEVEELLIPEDLDAALSLKPNARDYFLSCSKSARKAMLQWLVMAKRVETRQNRVNEIVTLAGQNKKPKHVL
jgi:uncharacterized protein YdeI (YjbR/CyaY-like superfamily)